MPLSAAMTEDEPEPVYAVSAFRPWVVSEPSAMLTPPMTLLPAGVARPSLPNIPFRIATSSLSDLALFSGIG